MKQYICYYLFLCSWLVSCQQTAETPAETTTNPCVISPELKKLITLTPVTSRFINNELQLTGSVSYDQDHIFRYQSLASGIVRKVTFNIGDYVQKGQVLVEVMTPELSTQKSELLQAKAELQRARRQQDATRAMHTDGVASDKDLLEASNQVVIAQAAIDRLQETLRIQGGNIENGLVTVRAPFSGYVVEKNLTVGSQIDAGQDDLFVLSNLKKIWVLANVYSTQLGQVQAGQRVDITSTAYPDEVFRGTINRIANVFDAEERVVKAVIELDNNALKLKPSMMVNVRVYQPTRQQAIAIPQQAVIFDNNAYHVLLHKTDCAVTDMVLTPLGSDQDFYYVKPGELAENDRVISQNQLLIYTKLKER
ncbi:efflux RND transporter periplasmic adaptor subunit [Spirosoma terrae]|uniref:Efflux RND transporter periplasmic adaptor subunit n=1 Tax=Spirosoma terrae TaxID=1968276 RepID=A0A6L9L9N0_9BACT|nr:efflux RND transporter periplasmic adaptor subunit [Spirosoma terrae]NDU95088.1 efflux RND transporter periplasmic adaptor subunit [Spirosoma terrae]